MIVYKEFRFEAAHRLPLVPPGHKCRRLHGHSYRIEVRVAGAVAASGFVIDFADVKATVQPVVDELDHYYLNAIPGLENPTCENLAAWLWTRLTPALPALCGIVVAETCTSGCIYEGKP